MLACAILVTQWSWRVLKTPGRAREFFLGQTEFKSVMNDMNEVPMQC